MELADLNRAIDTRNIADVRSAIDRFNSSPRLEAEHNSILESALEHAVSNYLRDIGDVLFVGKEDNFKKTLEIVKLFVDLRVSTTSPHMWNDIQFQSAMNPYVRGNFRRMPPLIFVLLENVDDATKRELFDRWVRDRVEDHMSNEEIEAVLVNPAALAYIPQFAELLPESLKNAWNRRKHAVIGFKKVQEAKEALEGGSRRRRATHRRRFSKKRKTTRRRRM